MRKVAARRLSILGASSSHLALGLMATVAIAGTSAPAWAAEEEGAADAADTGAEILVEGRRSKDVIEAGPLGSRTILETPFSVGTADTDQIKRIAATTIDAAFNYDPSIRSNNSGIASGNTFSIRGQSVDLTNGYKYDGLAFPYWFQDHPIEAVDQIQVLKGAGGFVYGYASPSGVVNFVSKKPTDDLVVSADLSLRSSTIWRAHVDIGGPLSDGGSTKFRFNAVEEQGTLYNGAYNKNTFAQLWLQGDITPDLTWSVDGYYQRTWQSRQSNTVSFTTAVTSLPTIDGADFNLASASTHKFNDINQVTGRLNYQVDSDWKISGALRYSALDERFTGNTAQIYNNAGDYRIGVLGMNRKFTYYVGQLSFEGNFHTGALEHTLVGGFDYLDVNYDYDYNPYTTTRVPTVSFDFNLTGNLYTGTVPDWGTASYTRADGQVVTGRQFQRPPNWFRYQEIRQRGLFLSDTLKLGNAELMLGGRYTFYRESNDEPVLVDTKYNEKSFTPVAALSYDVVHGARIYVSYVQALQRGAQAPANALNYGESFGPIKSKQYEAGIKVDRGTWGGTLAAFRSTVPSEFLNTQSYWVRDGERRFQGVEFDAHWQATPELLLKVGAAYLDAVQTKASSPALVGKKVPGATAFQTSGFVEYSPAFLPGVSAFGGVRYSGKAYGQVTNTFIYKPVTVGDAGLSYQLPIEGRSVTVSGNVQNITNEWYWVPGSGGTTLTAGAPRTFSLNLSVSTGPIERRDGRDELGAGEGVADSGFYIGASAGGLKVNGSDFDVRARVNPALGVVRNGLKTSYKTGWEVAGRLGYDFGLLRTELELARQQFELKQATLAASSIPLDTASSAAGTYDDPSGTTRIQSILANGLFDIGTGSRWALEVGGGIGIARVNQHRWTLDEGDARTLFAYENKLNFAWQAIAGVRYSVTDRLEATLRYRYFNVENAFLQTTTANALEGSFRTHNVLVGLNYHL